MFSSAPPLLGLCSGVKCAELIRIVSRLEKCFRHLEFFFWFLPRVFLVFRWLRCPIGSLRSLFLCGVVFGLDNVCAGFGMKRDMWSA